MCNSIVMFVLYLRFSRTILFERNNAISSINKWLFLIFIVYHYYIFHWIQFWSVAKCKHTHTHVFLSIVARFGLLVLFGTNHYSFLLKNIFCIATLYENYNKNRANCFTYIYTIINFHLLLSTRANRVQLENYYLIFSILLSDTG